jgi:lipopolysaccharide/colanic/teichoic acid biosynthesis glycosyltransferase
MWKNGLKNSYEDTLFARVFNIFVAGIFLIIFFPLLIVVYFLVMCDGTGGRVILKDPYRVGKDGKIFRLFKFRYMIPDAHNKMVNGEYGEDILRKWKKNGGKLDWREDPRITPVGRLLRRTDLDELPQFINVILGDMNIVGPRPYFSEEIENFKHRFPDVSDNFKKILSVRPGITGLWQVSGRNSLPVKKRIELDWECADKKSFWFDIWIIFRTPWIIITRKGAM